MTRSFNLKVKPHFDKGKAYRKLFKCMETKNILMGSKKKDSYQDYNEHPESKLKLHSIVHGNPNESMSISYPTSNHNGLQHAQTYVHSFTIHMNQVNSLYMGLKRVTRVDLFNLSMKSTSMYIKY